MKALTLFYIKKTLYISCAIIRVPISRLKGSLMMKHISVQTFKSLQKFSIFLAMWLLFLSPEAHAAKASPVKLLLGSWGGGGIMKLTDGSSERIRCNGYYTGGGTQLGMVIRCTSSSNKVEMRSKLSLNSNRISGSWEERTFNAEGQLSGKISGQKMNMSISGAVVGTMNVKFSKRQQIVTIRTNNIEMKSLNITLKRK